MRQRTSHKDAAEALVEQRTRICFHIGPPQSSAIVFLEAFLRMIVIHDQAIKPPLSR